MSFHRATHTSVQRSAHHRVAPRRTPAQVAATAGLVLVLLALTVLACLVVAESLRPEPDDLHSAPALRAAAPADAGSWTTPGTM